eukprot:scaffold140371_cov169-Phaeocystis_antarctica.AAC.1
MLGQLDHRLADDDYLFTYYLQLTTYYLTYHLLEEREVHSEEQREGRPGCGGGAADNGDPHAMQRPLHLL